MSVHLRIDHLVLEGLSLSPRDGLRLQTSLDAELTKLLQDRGLHPALARGIAVPSLPVTSMAMTTGANLSHLGRQIARNLAGSLTAKARP